MMAKRPIRIALIILGVLIIAVMIFYTALPSMGKVLGLEGIQAEDISDIKFVVSRERQEAWILDDAEVIAETISYFNGLKAVPALRTGGGALVYLHINLLEPTGSGDSKIIITIFTERQYHDANGNYYALGKVKSSAQWEEILQLGVQQTGDEKVGIEIWKEFLPDYLEALRIIYLSLEINTDSWDKDGFFLVIDKYNRMEELKAVLNTAFTNEFIEKNKSEPSLSELSLFDGESAFYRENQGQLYLQAAEVIVRPLPVVSGRYPNSTEQNDSELIVTFNDLDNGFGNKFNAVFTLCRDELGEWKLNEYESYFFEGQSLIKIDDRSFELEDIPENTAEETVMKDFLYTITADFESKYSILADLDPHNISIENEKKWFQKDVYTQSYTIHKISTLSEDESNSDDSLYRWKDIVDKYNLLDYKIVNVEYTVTLSEKANALGPQYGEGTFSRSFIVGKTSADNSYKIYDFGVPLFIDH